MMQENASALGILLPMLGLLSQGSVLQVPKDRGPTTYPESKSCEAVTKTALDGNHFCGDLEAFTQFCEDANACSQHQLPGSKMHEPFTPFLEGPCTFSKLPFPFFRSVPVPNRIQRECSNFVYNYQKAHVMHEKMEKGPPVPVPVYTTRAPAPAGPVKSEPDPKAV